MPMIQHQTTDFDNYLFRTLMRETLDTTVERSYTINPRGKYEHSEISPDGLELTLEKYPQVDPSQTRDITDRLGNPMAETLRIKKDGRILALQITYRVEDNLSGGRSEVRELDKEHIRIKATTPAGRGKINRQYFPKQQSGYILEALRLIEKKFGISISQQ
ncbi:MAG: hypothetical protein ABIJ18_01760 [archaeon]